MRKFAKIIALLAALVMVFTLAAGCDTSPSPSPAGNQGNQGNQGNEGNQGNQGGEPAATGTVGISMPTMSLQRWNQDGSNMKQAFEAAGFTVNLQFAENNAATQINQIENMIALAEAQELGYAEKDPAADVDGYDACRKLAILLSLATGQQVSYEEIHTEGIRQLTLADFAFARHFGYNIKLEALTAPMLVHHSHPLSVVSDVFNGVMVQARMTGSVLFYGRGAGKRPTAGAVVSDIVDIAKHLHRHIMHTWSETITPVLPLAQYHKRKMVRIAYGKEGTPPNAEPGDTEKAAQAVHGLLGRCGIFELPEYPGQLAWLTERESETETQDNLAKLSATGCFTGPARVLRIYESVEINEG
jgi:hypothetical protein